MKGEPLLREWNLAADRARAAIAAGDLEGLEAAVETREALLPQLLAEGRLDASARLELESDEADLMCGAKRLLADTESELLELRSARSRIQSRTRVDPAPAVTSQKA